MKYYFLILTFVLFGCALAQKKEIAHTDTATVYFIPYDITFFVELDKNTFLKSDMIKKVQITNPDTIKLILIEIENSIKQGVINDAEPDIRLYCKIKNQNNEEIDFYLDRLKYIYLQGKKYNRNYELYKLLKNYTGQ